MLARERVPITYLDGQRSVCFLPPSDGVAGQASVGGESPTTRVASFPITDGEKLAAIGSTLRSVHGGAGAGAGASGGATQCVTTSNSDYWQYRVCPFGTVEQFHGKGTSATAFHLGRYNSTEKMAVPLHAAKRGVDFAVYTQQFSGGTDGRETQVRTTYVGARGGC